MLPFYIIIFFPYLYPFLSLLFYFILLFTSSSPVSVLIFSFPFLRHRRNYRCLCCEWPFCCAHCCLVFCCRSDEATHVPIFCRPVPIPYAQPWDVASRCFMVSNLGSAPLSQKPSVGHDPESLPQPIHILSGPSVVAMKLCPCIPEVLGSNLGLNRVIWGFRGFPQYFRSTLLHYCSLPSSCRLSHDHPV